MSRINQFFLKYKTKVIFFLIAFSTILLIHFNNLYLYFGHHSFSENFVDWEFIRGFAKCNIENKNRFYDISCDVLGRRSVYPPIWIYTPKIIYYFNSNFIFISSIIFFTFTVIKFIKIEKLSQGFILLLILSSPYFLYGYHRLNIDIIIIPALIFAIYFYERYKNLTSYFIIIFCTFLKIYPVAIYLVLFKENKKKFFQFISISFFFGVFFLICHLDEIIIMSKNMDMTGSPGNGVFSGTNLFYFILKLFNKSVSEQNIIFIFANILLLILLFLILPTFHFKDSKLRKLEEVFFTCGFLILIFCFFSSYNINYRLMYVVFFLPLFFNQYFCSDKVNKKLSTLFLLLFFLKSHVNTVLGNIAMLEYYNFINTKISIPFIQGTQYSYILNLTDAIIQWIMIAILITIFKKNNLKKIIF